MKRDTVPAVINWRTTDIEVEVEGGDRQAGWCGVHLVVGVWKGQTKARLFDAARGDLLLNVVVDHYEVDRGNAVLTLESGLRWWASHVGDCGCGG